MKIMQEMEEGNVKNGVFDSPFASPFQETNQPSSTGSIRVVSEKIKVFFTL
jgi:hypothetical protein